jgi:hypothetical protein|uniref:Uncharacterized protein n=1 Tax=Siphoviridae sp. ctpoI7 TaxID=2825678 RepID=A0A8S5PA68_9CAUD|nr:MAG TPA: hypothetical protein [Siphoviridae sp. ctpoI7]
MSRIEELEKQITELDERKVALQKELELEKQKTEIGYPFEESEEYWGLDIDGELIFDRWTGCQYDENCFEVGNMFKTAQEAKKERDKRILLTRLKQFRNKCNGDWKPAIFESKYYIIFNRDKNILEAHFHCFVNVFDELGYFRKESDAKRAIELFGDEIIRLWVEE